MTVSRAELGRSAHPVSCEMPRNGLNGGQFRQFGCRIFMRFVAEMTESASQGTPFAPVQLCGDSIRPHPGAAEFTGPKISEWRYGVPRLLSFYAVTMVLNPGGEGK